MDYSEDALVEQPAIKLFAQGTENALQCWGTH